ASEHTATVRRPDSRQARSTRAAISPRLATSTLSKGMADATRCAPARARLPDRPPDPPAPGSLRPCPRAPTPRRSRSSSPGASRPGRLPPPSRRPSPRRSRRGREPEPPHRRCSPYPFAPRGEELEESAQGRDLDTRPEEPLPDRSRDGRCVIGVTVHADAPRAQRQPAAVADGHLALGGQRDRAGGHVLRIPRLLGPLE